MSRVVELMAEKQMREKRLITSTTIMEETGLTRPTVLAWIRSDLRRFDADTGVALCKFFDCEIGDLLVLENAEENQ